MLDMKRLRGAVVAFGLGATSLMAQAEVTGNIGVTSNYIWRGVSQTQDGPAVQGGLDYTHDSGFYLGTWLSNVDFAEVDDSNEIELDLYGGYGGSIGDFGYDIGLTHYTYPLAEDADFTELGVSGSYKMVSAGLAYTVASQVEGDSAFVDGDVYYWGGLDLPLPNDMGLGLTIGHYDFDVSSVDDYTHVRAGISKAGFELAIEKNDLDGTDANGKDFDDMRFVVSWSKSF